MGVIEDHYIIICGNPPPDYAVTAISVTIKFALHVIAIVLAIRTRKIEVEAVNDAKEIQAIVYISTALIIIAMVCNFTLEGYANLYGILLGILTLLDSATFLGLTFIPKVGYTVFSYNFNNNNRVHFYPQMVILAKDPAGNNVFKAKNNYITRHDGVSATVSDHKHTEWYIKLHNDELN